MQCQREHHPSLLGVFHENERALCRASVVFHCSRRLCWIIERAVELAKVAKCVSREAQIAARLNISRRFVTKHNANSRHLFCR
jgi:hypothetical protein